MGQNHENWLARQGQNRNRVEGLRKEEQGNEANPGIQVKMGSTSIFH
jgi:hypothetical protein